MKMDVFVMSRPCLKGTIQNAETAVVKCPYTDQDYSCDMQLLDREIKSVGGQYTGPPQLYVTLFGTVLPIYRKFEFSTQIWYGASYVTYLCCVQAI